MKVRNRVVRCLLLLLALALLTGCTPEANVSTPAPTSTTPAPVELYPAELEEDFVVLCDHMDDQAYLPTGSVKGIFYLITKEPITEADVSVRTEHLDFRVQLQSEECFAADNLLLQGTLYAAFLAYKNMDWGQLYDIATQSSSKASAMFNSFWDDCAAKWEAWYPKFYCYAVSVSSLVDEGLAAQGPYIETELTVTVKGSSQVLPGVCNFVLHEAGSFVPTPEDMPLRIYEMQISPQAVRPTNEGYFYSLQDALFQAKRDLTITGASFQNCDSAGFVEMELVIGGVRMHWDGKTPIDVAAGEIVEFRFIAEDPTLCNILAGSFARNAQLELTCEGKEYLCRIVAYYYASLNAYQGYAIADGRRDALYSYFVDYHNKASGWQPGYVRVSYDGTGATGNPFLDG